ncbi:MAG: hypothetical protein JWM95_2229 [Gemmatimonadetes bacterium]|nr:hypothetical protein [Gemmatimonadota bacterium]
MSSVRVKQVHRSHRSLGTTTLVFTTILIIAPGVASAQADTTTRRPALPPAALSVGPPIRKISTASALSTEQLGSITSVRQLKDGRVLLNDGNRRRLLMLDTSLKVIDVVLDSLSESANFYGTRAGGLLPYRGDTTLFIDAAAYAMLVIDPQGKIARVRSVPRVQDAYTLTGNGNGIPGVDANGRIIYRMYAEAAPPKVAPPPGTPWFPQEPDSAFIVGIDADTRKLDTLGSIRIPKQENSIRVSPTGGFNFTSVTNPLPSTDEWAVLPDGVIAFVRGRDYRVEYRQPDGKLVSSAKLPYPWQHLAEEDKQKLVDSVRAVQTRQAMNGYITQLIRWVNQYGNDYPKDIVVPKDYVLQQGLQKDTRLPPGLSFPAKYIYACAQGEEPTMLNASPEAAPAVAGPPGAPAGTPSCIPTPISVAGGNSPPMPQIRTNGVMAPADLPDYKPPFATNAVRADGDGNLWVKINTPTPMAGGPVYDLINRKGELADRLQLPPGYNLVGFGAGRVVYLAMRDAKGQHLARVVLR